MKPNSPLEQLEGLKTESDALDQSVALNKIVMTMLESKRKEDFWLRIILIISLLVNVVISGIFIGYESQMMTTTTTTETTTTVDQDTNSGSGNNIYQAGENAAYTQEGVTPNGSANSSNDLQDDNSESEQGLPTSSNQADIKPSGKD